MDLKIILDATKKPEQRARALLKNLLQVLKENPEFSENLVFWCYNIYWFHMPFILFVILKTLPKCISIDLKIEICMAAARILLHWFHVWKYAKLQIMLLFAYETSMKEMQLHYVQYNLQFVSSTGRFPFSWNFRADRKSLILELSMRNRKNMR